MTSVSNLFSIVVMQGFNGLSSFAVLLLMALGLAIIFGQMGVINMAHGEFLTIGAYTTYVLSALAERWPVFQKSYFLLAVADGRYITEARTAAVSAVSARHMARRDAAVLAIIGSGRCGWCHGVLLEQKGSDTAEFGRTLRRCGQTSMRRPREHNVPRRRRFTSC